MPKLRALFNNSVLQDEQQARAVCERLCNARPDLPRVKTVAAVGSYDAVIGGTAEDSRRLTAVMAYMLRSGFLIDPDFSIDVVNFSKRRDFLAEKKTADLVFVSFILAQHLSSTSIYGKDVDRMAKALPENPDPWFQLAPIFGRALSRHHNEQAWQERLAACAPKMVVTYGGQHEISTQVLCGGDNKSWLVPVIDTPRHEAAAFAVQRRNSSYDMESRAKVTTLYDDARADVPLPWLGFAGNRAYVAAMRDHLSAVTMLGRRARDLKPL